MIVVRSPTYSSSQTGGNPHVQKSLSWGEMLVYFSLTTRAAAPFLYVCAFHFAFDLSGHTWADQHFANTDGGGP